MYGVIPSLSNMLDICDTLQIVALYLIHLVTFPKSIKYVQLHAVIVQVCGGKKEKLVSQTPDFNIMDVLKGRRYESVHCYHHLKDDHVSSLSITPGFTLSSEQI